MRIFLGFIIAPCAVLLMWFGLPIFKEVMINVTTTWGTNLGGIALIIANLMPLIVPVACVAGIIAGFVLLAKSSG